MDESVQRQISEIANNAISEINRISQLVRSTLSSSARPEHRAGRLEKRETGIRNRNGNRNRNRKRNWNRNWNGKRNLYKSRDNIYFNLSYLNLIPIQIIYEK